MKWATRALIHFDRVVSAWLILRFVDSRAEFVFLADDERPDEGTTPFGIQGARLAGHDEGMTTFQRVLTAYDLRDAALGAIAAVAADIVAHVMHGDGRADLAGRNPLAAGVLAFAEGAMLLSASDDECLSRSLPFYDALYARLQAQAALDAASPSPPASVLDQTLLLSRATRRLREEKKPFSVQAFDAGLQDFD